jgi:hypothetical protein
MIKCTKLQKLVNPMNVVLFDNPGKLAKPGKSLPPRRLRARGPRLCNLRGATIRFVTFPVARVARPEALRRAWWNFDRAAHWRKNCNRTATNFSQNRLSFEQNDISRSIHCSQKKIDFRTTATNLEARRVGKGAQRKTARPHRHTLVNASGYQRPTNH